MRKMVVFNTVTLDGYFADINGDSSWAHSQDAEWNAFVADNAKAGGLLVFGRVTYELMIQSWPTPLATQNDPVVAERMNNMPNVVFFENAGQDAVEQYQVGEGRHSGGNPEDEA